MSAGERSWINPRRVRALFAADELSMDFDWRRVRLSMLHASGDGNPTIGGQRDSIR